MGHLTLIREPASGNAYGMPYINSSTMDPAMGTYFRLPGAGTLIKLAGFVKTDVFIEANQAGSYSYSACAPSSFPSSSQPDTVNAMVPMPPSRFSLSSETILYKKSGLLGISGISNDMRDLLASREPAARLAVDYFVYRATKEIGALAAVLGGSMDSYSPPVSEKTLLKSAACEIRVVG